METVASNSASTGRRTPSTTRKSMRREITRRFRTARSMPSSTRRWARSSGRWRRRNGEMRAMERAESAAALHASMSGWVRRRRSSARSAAVASPSRSAETSDVSA